MAPQRSLYELSVLSVECYQISSGYSYICNLKRIFSLIKFSLRGLVSGSGWTDKWSWSRLKCFIRFTNYNYNNYIATWMSWIAWIPSLIKSFFDGRMHGDLFQCRYIKNIDWGSCCQQYYIIYVFRRLGRLPTVLYLLYLV